MSLTRTLTIPPGEIVKLLQALTAPQSVRLIDGGIPFTAALAKAALNDNGDLELELVCHEWTADQRDTPIRLSYARRFGNTLDSNAWGAPIQIAADTE